MSNFDLFANLPSWRTWTKDKERRDKKMKVVSVNSGDSVPCCCDQDKCLHSLQSCLHLADWHQWQLVYLKQISPPSPPRPRPVSYLFSKPTSKLETKLRLISTDLVCSRYFVIFSKPVSGEAVNIWFCWDCCETLKFYSQSTNRNWGRQVAGLKIKW